MARKRVLLGLVRRLMTGRKVEVRSLVEQSLRAHGIQDIARAAIINWLSTPRVILGLGRRRLLAGMLAVQGLVVLEIQRRIDADGLMRILTSPDDLERRNVSAELQRSLEVEGRRFQDLKQRFRALEEAKLADEKALLVAQIAHAKLLGPIDRQ